MDRIGLLRTAGLHFVDEHQRVVLLRGVNLAGISIPAVPDGATHIKDPWPPADLEHVSWVGRPFPLEECEEHFRRLRAWGFNCIRLLASWEAVEHAGPYQYDTKFLDYFTELARRAGDHGFYVFINFHQDVWSRVTGGDGAPLWLFGKIGLDYTKFDRADAAITMQYLWDADPAKNRYEMQSWGQNEKLFPVRTMWTLFWAGRDFAPRLVLADEATGEQVDAQEYFQRHFLGVIKQVVERVKAFPHVFGFNPLNEPSSGYINCKVSLRPRQIKGVVGREMGVPGIAWSPLDTMAAAAGHARDIEDLGINVLKGGLSVKKIVTVNPQRVNLWKPGAEDFWRAHGVWEERGGEAVALEDDYFKLVRGRPVDFTRDYAVPFYERVNALMRSYNKNWLLLLENDPFLNGPASYNPWPATMPPNIVDAFHWYDLAQLGLKRFFWPLNFDLTRMRPVWGAKGIQKMYTRQFARHVDLCRGVNSGTCPALVGEFGIAMDMSGGKAYREWSSRGERAFKWHSLALNLMYNALDSLFLSGTHWNYVPFNRNGLGDFWNLEDLSIFSRDQVPKGQVNDIFAGARGLRGFCRPFASHIAGHPQRMEFNWKTRVFTLEYDTNPTSSAKTIIFVPRCQYPDGHDLHCSGGIVENHPEDQTVIILDPSLPRISLTITPK